MRKIISILMILMLIGVASAAVYVTTNPEARAFFTRNQPGPDVSPIVTMFNSPTGWSNSVDFGTMESNYFEKQLSHRNIDASNFTGIIRFDVECAEGLVDNGAGGIKDFADLVYNHPNLNSYSCNNESCVERISSTKITVIPTNETFTFVPDELVLSSMKIEFIDMAYGDYTVTVYVE